MGRFFVEKWALHLKEQPDYMMPHGAYNPAVFRKLPVPYLLHGFHLKQCFACFDPPLFQKFDVLIFTELGTEDR